jgi:transcriptional regulator with XRE-family HTH domain
LHRVAIARKERATSRRACPEDVAIAHRLRVLRLERGLSQSEVARHAGVSFQQFQKYENGSNRVSAGRLQRIAAALDVSVVWFYGSVPAGDERSLAYLSSRGALRLARAYADIAERGSRMALIKLAEALAQS